MGWGLQSHLQAEGGGGQCPLLSLQWGRGVGRQGAAGGPEGPHRRPWKKEAQVIREGGRGQKR